MTYRIKQLANIVLCMVIGAMSALHAKVNHVGTQEDLQNKMQKTRCTAVMFFPGTQASPAMKAQLLPGSVPDMSTQRAFYEQASEAIPQINFLMVSRDTKGIEQIVGKFGVQWAGTVPTFALFYEGKFVAQKDGFLYANAIIDFVSNTCRQQAYKGKQDLKDTYPERDKELKVREEVAKDDRKKSDQQKRRRKRRRRRRETNLRNN